MEEGGPLTRQSVLARSGGVSCGTLGEEMAEEPKMDDGDAVDQQPLVDRLQEGNDEGILLSRAISHHLDLIEASISSINVSNEHEMAGHGVIRSASVHSALMTVQCMLKQLSDDFSCKAELTRRFNDAERSHQARCPPSLDFKRIHSEIHPNKEPPGSSITLARRTTIDALTNDEENKYSLIHDCSIDRGDMTCESQSSTSASDVTSELGESMVKTLSQTDMKDDITTYFTAMYNWGSGSFGSLWHHKSGPVEILHPERSQVSGKTRRRITCVSINENHSAAITCTGEVLAIGMNDNGEVDPEREESGDNMIKRPTIVEALVTHLVVSVSCGLRHTACLTSSGTVITYGSNENFACGHPPSPFNPFRVSARAMNLGRRCGAAVACGDRFTMILTTHMEVLICGIGECTADAQKTDEHGDVSQPSLIPSLTGLPITYIVAGSSHALVVTSLGYAYAWGFNPGGCCGLSALSVVHYPTRLRIESGSPAWLKDPPSSKLTSGDPTSGSEMDIPFSELLVSDSVTVANAAAGRQHTVLITRSGRILCCGRNKNGQCGFDPIQPGGQNICPPREPCVTKYLDDVHLESTSKPRFVFAACGDVHTLLLDDNGDVWHMGTLDVLPSSSWRPARKLSISSGPLNAFFVAAGGMQSVALSSSGTRASGIGTTSTSAAVDSSKVSSFTPMMMVRQNRPKFVSPDIELLKHLEDFEQNGMGQQDRGNGKLIRAVEELFKRPSVLMNAFYKPELLEHLYKRLLSAGKDIGIVEALTEGIRKGLARLSSQSPPKEEAVRCFLLYWQCPIHVHPAKQGYNASEDIFISVCNHILSLPYPGHRALLGWIKVTYPHHLFASRLILPLQEHISNNIRMVGLNGRPLHVLCSVMNSLHNINSRGYTSSGQLGSSALDSLYDENAGRIVPIKLFYNSTANELPEGILVEDFIIWRQSSPEERSRAFFLCCFPFLLTPSNKMLLLRSEVEFMRMKSGLGSYVFVLQVDREYIVQQTIMQIASAPVLAYKMKLKVQFMGEEAVDEGGPRQEFFLLLTSRLFDTDLGMWDEIGDRQLWFNKDCTWNDDAYTLVGIILGLAIYNGALVDVSFPQVLYRKLLGLPLGFEDLYDEDVRNNLRKLLDYDGTDMEGVFGLNFEVNWQSFGETMSVELIPGGKDIPLTSENVFEYVKLFVKFTLVDSVRRQFDLFKAGFDRVMEDTSISLFQPEELEYIVVGTKELDIGALERVARYEGGYDANTPVVRFFWRFMAEADITTRQKVLKFVTGSKSAPIGGLEKVPFKIQRAGPDSPSLPTSSTCFSILLLPEYSTYEKLCNCLSIAVNQCVGFGLY